MHDVTCIRHITSMDSIVSRVIIVSTCTVSILTIARIVINLCSVRSRITFHCGVLRWLKWRI